MNKLALAVFMSLPLLLASCSDDDDTYPSIVTEMADGLTNSNGTLTTIITDNDEQYSLTNPQAGLYPNALYRLLCGYTVQGQAATLYTLEGVYILRDSTSVAQRDPLTIVSAWQTSRYINLHLSVKTQGGTHSLGYVTDSIVGSHAYLSLHHRQGQDPEAYSTDIYASIPLDSIEGSLITLEGTYQFER
ncbi:MAG: hypothetical protein LUC86_09185 [Prevotellaceae bacterium]|nr:hypothetical protein [Prevotellaceae bacterium]